MLRYPNPWRRLARAALVFAIAGAGLMLSGCSGIIGPHSPSAVRIASLWWTSFGISVVVFIIVMGFLAYGLFRRRDHVPSIFENRPHAAMLFIVISGAVVPLIILIGIFTYSVKITAANTEMKPNALHVEAIGHDFYWEFVYPDQGIRTINTLHIPVNQPIDLTTTGADVIHSFWVPELNGKLDALPGITNSMTFTTSDVGQYRGRCAEFCGKGHACMDFATVAEDPAQFQDWVATIKQQTFRLPNASDVDYMLDQCFNDANFPVCMPVGCPPGAKANGSVQKSPPADGGRQASG